MKRALITGIGGQDGTYLSQYLSGKGYQVAGIAKAKPSLNGAAKIFNTDLSNSKSVFMLLKNFKPQEIYHLAAYHHSSEEKITLSDLEVFERSIEVNVLSTANLLEGMHRFCPKAKLFFAASSHMFGATRTHRQNEDTPFQPNCLYGITKFSAMKLCHFYREKYRLFASVGILFNHESPLRKSKFLTKKIIKTAVAIKKGAKRKLVVGDLQAEVDWGYAKDYVVTMYRILQLKNPTDFIISSGKKHTVKYFIEEVFDYLNLNWYQHVKVDNNLLKRKRKSVLFGDNRKLIAQTGWRPSVTLKELIAIMVEDELAR